MSPVLAVDPAAITATGRASAPPARRARAGLSFGKYREIIIAVAFFLLFDLGVLVLNFYTSFKIDQDTVAINLAGRQLLSSLGLYDQGGHAQTVRPLMAPMVLGAAENAHGALPEATREKLQAMTAAS